mmetsp:Transcript_61163/g.157740  ORF Transcript_61163/g.157740 Transcript_61163/m.157740 type:complete len:301 (+) Transcript_61163:290-1192(+)
MLQGHNEAVNLRVEAALDPELECMPGVRVGVAEDARRLAPSKRAYELAPVGHVEAHGSDVVVRRRCRVLPKRQRLVQSIARGEVHLELVLGGARRAYRTEEEVLVEPVAALHDGPAPDQHGGIDDRQRVQRLRRVFSVAGARVVGDFPDLLGPALRRLADHPVHLARTTIVGTLDLEHELAAGRGLLVLAHDVGRVQRVRSHVEHVRGLTDVLDPDGDFTRPLLWIAAGADGEAHLRRSDIHAELLAGVLVDAAPGTDAACPVDGALVCVGHFQIDVPQQQQTAVGSGFEMDVTAIGPGH